ncbi:hypothetical protein Tco_0186257 [Tanacetum coccineum]
MHGGVATVGTWAGGGGGCDGSGKGDCGGHRLEMVAGWGLRWCVMVKRMVDRSGVEVRMAAAAVTRISPENLAGKIRGRRK